MTGKKPSGADKRVQTQKQTQLPACGYVVTATKKGSLPISIEKRPKGKRVTIIANVEGKANALLSVIRGLLGTGGTVQRQQGGHFFAIEIQGDQTKRLGQILEEVACVRGLVKDPTESNGQRECQVAARICGYDKFLRQNPANRAAYDPDPMPLAHCRQWHGPWIFCRGDCFQASFDDVYVEDIMGKRTDADCVSAEPESTVENVAELALALRGLGMFSEPGAAVRRTSPDLENVAMVVPRSSGAGVAPKGQANQPQGRERCVFAPPRTHSNLTCINDSGDGASDGITRPSSRLPGLKKQKPAPKLGRYICGICEAEFSLVATLKAHARRAHPGQKLPAVRPTGAIGQNVGNGVGAAGDGEIEINAVNAASDELRSDETPCEGGEVAFAEGYAPTRAESQHAEAFAGGPAFKASAPTDEWGKLVSSRREASQRASLVNGRQVSCVVDVPGLHIEVVGAAFEPMGEGADRLLKLFLGDRICVYWRQPKEEGGYWGYGKIMGRSGEVGYFPLGVLAVRAPAEHVAGDVISKATCRRLLVTLPPVTAPMLEDSFTRGGGEPEEHRQGRVFESVRSHDSQDLCGCVRSQLGVVLKCHAML